MNVEVVVFVMISDVSFIALVTISGPKIFFNMRDMRVIFYLAADMRNMLF